jgi:hypothetical protein
MLRERAVKNQTAPIPKRARRPKKTYRKSG